MANPYPAQAPYKTHRLRVSELHELYIEESGNPDGKPIVFVHGGPGGGTEPWQRTFFNPQKYRIVLFDQRGCGKINAARRTQGQHNLGFGCGHGKIRELLGIEKWVVFGGSWGSTLALAYAQTHPQRCKGIVLRGIFLIRPEEIRWFYQEGCSWVYPDAWEHYVNAIPEAERGDFVQAYYRRLTSSDPAVRKAAAKAWSIWEGSTSKLLPNEDMISRFGGDEFADAFARIECHYFINNGFLRPNQLLEDVGKIRHIPGVIVQGRYDVVCPMKSAWDLHRAWPEAELHVIADAGHAASETGIMSKLVEATDRFVDL